MLLLCKLVNSNRFDWNIKFYSQVLKWKTGIYFDIPNCNALNFGYNGEIPFPQVDFGAILSPVFPKFFPSCLLVFVGGKYVKKPDTVVQALEVFKKSHYDGPPPAAIFIMSKLKNTDAISVFARIKTIPTVLSLLRIIIITFFV